MTLTADQDKGISDQRGRRQCGQVSEQAEGQDDYELGSDEVLDRDKLFALGDSEDECLQVLGNENGIGCETRRDDGPSTRDR